jgi:hypothetical protein
MIRVALRPAVAADLQYIIGEPLPFRIKALTAHIDERVLGVGGLGYLPNGIVGAFVGMTEEGRRYPVAIHRAGLAAMKMIRESGEPRVVALADHLIPSAERWLERLGFEAVTVDGITAYVWQAS